MNVFSEINLQWMKILWSANSLLTSKMLFLVFRQSNDSANSKNYYTILTRHIMIHSTISPSVTFILKLWEYYWNSKPIYQFSFSLSVLISCAEFYFQTMFIFRHHRFIYTKRYFTKNKNSVGCMSNVHDKIISKPFC